MRDPKDIRVLLVRTPQKFFHARFPQGPRLGIPSGLLAIGSYIQRQGVDVKIFDAFVEGSQYSFLNNKNEFKKSNTSKKDKMIHFGASWDEISQLLQEYKPDLIGVSAIFDETYHETMQLSNLAKKILPNTFLFVGGPSATSNAEDILNDCSSIDVVCKGDGEETTFELIESICGQKQLKDVKNIVLRGHDKNEHTQDRVLPLDLDHLGPINYDLIDLEKYFSLESKGIMSRQRFNYKGSNRAVSITTSRGCPYNCSFCSVHLSAGKKYRTFSAEHVINHLEVLVNKYGVNHIHLEDDNLTLDKKRFYQIVDGIKERKLSFTWDTPNGVFADTLEEEMMLAMKEIGCTYLVVAVESGDQFVIDNVIDKKPMTIEAAVNAFKTGKKIGLDMQAFYVIGFPRETWKQVNKTIQFAWKSFVKYDVMPHVNIATANKGTDLYYEAMNLNAISNDNPDERKTYLGIRLDKYSRPLISTKEFTAEKLLKLTNLFYFKFSMLIFFRLFFVHLTQPSLMCRTILSMIKSYQSSGKSIKEMVMLMVFTRFLYPKNLQREKSSLIWDKIVKV